MLPSGNDAAYALAEIGGTALLHANTRRKTKSNAVEIFVEEMNK